MLAVVMACGAAFSPAVHRLRRRVAGSGVRGFGVLGIGVWGFRVRGSLWLLFVLPALAAGFGALDDAGRTAIVPNLVRRSELAGVNAIFQALFQFGLVAGPAVAGLLLAGAGVRFVYWMDVASFGAALALVVRRFREPLAYVLCSSMSWDAASRIGEHPGMSVHQWRPARLRLASPHPNRNKAR
jgi:MFS family permease